jgi:polyhydroxybutyrate depolymerase
MLRFAKRKAWCALMFERLWGQPKLAPMTILLATLATTLAVRGVHAEPLQVVVNGQARTALLERPADRAPRPTIIMLHEAYGTAARTADRSGLAQLGPRNGFAAVFPEGRGSRWNFFPSGKESAREVEFFRQHGGVPDDVAFLKTLVADLVRRGVSDPKRIYLAGRSLGGVMALRMVCADAGTFAAVGLLIAAMPEPTGGDCRPAKPIPALMINGTADQILPYGGGQSNRGDTLWSAERLVAYFRRLNGCSEAAQQSILPGQHLLKIEVEGSTKCPGGPIVFYRIVEGGHDVPPALNASQLLLDFFRDKVR